MQAAGPGVRSKRENGKFPTLPIRLRQLCKLWVGSWGVWGFWGSWGFVTWLNCGLPAPPPLPQSAILTRGCGMSSANSFQWQLPSTRHSSIKRHT
eukprot:353666-Chlamydomonas_euryale.AAC.6